MSGRLVAPEKQLQTPIKGAQHFIGHNTYIGLPVHFVPKYCLSFPENISDCCAFQHSWLESVIYTVPPPSPTPPKRKIWLFITLMRPGEIICLISVLSFVKLIAGTFYCVYKHLSPTILSMGFSISDICMKSFQNWEK